MLVTVHRKEGPAREKISVWKGEGERVRVRKRENRRERGRGREI